MKLQKPNEILIPEIAKLIQEGHSVTLTLSGNSMRPFLKDKRDTAKLVKTNELHIFDIVLAEVSPKRYALHRIVQLKGDEVTLLGDGNLTPEHCQRKDVIAKAVFFYRKGKQTPDNPASRKWKCYAWCWHKLHPVRRYLLALHKLLFG